MRSAEMTDVAEIAEMPLPSTESPIRGIAGIAASTVSSSANGARTYGAAVLARDKWRITGEPHVLMMFKRVFTGLQRQYGTLTFSNTESNAELLEWIMLRYPLEITAAHRRVLDTLTASARAKRARADTLLRGGTPTPVRTLIPLRPYQLLAVDLLRLKTSLLVGDDLGLGKTCVALGAIAAGLQPAIVVCKTHLQLQWKAEAEKFLFGVRAHIVKKGKPYDLPEHNLLIITYSKLAGWAEYLRGYQLIAFDEAQELRRTGTDKHAAATHMASRAAHRLGLTATPVYNYGDEIYSLVNLLAPRALGSHAEFLAEWCTPMGTHHKVNDPDALGSHLAENHLFLRRRRAQVGRELPPVTKIVEEVQHDEKRLLAMEDTTLQLAKTILRGTWEERGKAALELDALMRQQTGLAKAPYVAEFVQQLVEAGESVLLAGWHREVYTVWQKMFRTKGIESRLYTGSETPAKKAQAAQEFIDGAASVLILSLRSGEGLNGLQHKASVIVFGELDWSPQVHEQCIGRLNRDGQPSPVTAVYLHAAGGSDPVILQTLGVKRAQSEGIINPGLAEAAATQASVPEQAETARAAQLARAILDRAGVPAEVEK